MRPQFLEVLIDLILEPLHDHIEANIDSILLELLLIRQYWRIDIRRPPSFPGSSSNALVPGSCHLRDIEPGEGNEESLVVRRELSIGGCTEKGSKLEGIQNEHRRRLLQLRGESVGIRTPRLTFIEGLKVLVHLQQHSGKVSMGHEDIMFLVALVQPLNEIEDRQLVD